VPTRLTRKTHAAGVALLCIMTTASCTRNLQTSAHRVPATAVSVVMERQVKNAQDAGDGDLEAKLLRRRLAANPLDLDARILLARLYDRRGLSDLALEHYRMAAALFPDSVLVTSELAKTLREAGESEAALKALQDYRSRRTGATAWDLLSLEGILQDELGRFDLAEKAHREALALDPGRRSLHNNLGYNLLLQGRAGDAAAEFRRAIEIDPHSAIAHNNLGTALAATPSQALAEMGRSTPPAVAHNNLAAVLIEQGRYAEARTELALALAFRRDFPEALANLKLVSERDGLPATVPVVRKAVNFRQRAASTWAKVIGDKSSGQ
jgi:Flp pilus assembly protein TadD